MMAGFKQLTVKGFRRLLDLDIAMRPLTVMIGVNGVGKSSLLESLSLLSSSAEGKPEEVLVVDMQEGGIASATWGDALDLDTWLDEYTLDEVWRMGRMGGKLNHGGETHSHLEGSSNG